MKTIKTMVLMMMCAVASFAQNTYYGTSAGTTGTNNSSFGYFTGNSATGANNAFFGYIAGQLSTTGGGNTGLGAYALTNNGAGVYNTGVGLAVLYYSTGSYNVAFGANSLNTNTTGSNNTGVGERTLYNNTTGANNSAGGYRSLYSNTTASNNTAFGHQALYSNTTGADNTASGYLALYTNDIGSGNAAFGRNALNYSTGSNNTAMGYLALFNTTTGTHNTAIGKDAGYSNTTGSYNTALGHLAGGSNTTGTGNTSVGYSAGPNITTATNSAALGWTAIPTTSNMVRIGNSAVTKIEGQVNFSTPSDLRFKNEIKEDVPGIDFINRLRPVSYLMNTSAYDEFVGVSSESKTLLDQMRPKPTRQIGFIAQEVEKIVKDGYVFSGLIVPENDKDHYSLRYAEFVVPLVKAVQELNAKVQSQQQQIENLINGLGKNVDSAATAPTPRIKLNQNVPNPFSSETEIRMSIPESTRSASLMVFSLDGKELKSIEVRSRGDNVKITISAGELSAGMYLYSLITDGQIADTKRLILTK